MKLVRTVFIALAMLLPVSWTVAKAADPAPAAEGDKNDTKKKTKSAPGAGDTKDDTKTDMKTETKTEKKTEKK